MRLQSREGKVEDLKVPGDAHAQEELDEDHHLVPFLIPAAADAAMAINTNILKGKVYLLGLADVDHNVDEHAGVHEQENKHWKIEPEK